MLQQMLLILKVPYILFVLNVLIRRSEVYDEWGIVKTEEGKWCIYFLLGNFLLAS